MNRVKALLLAISLLAAALTGCGTSEKEIEQRVLDAASSAAQAVSSEVKARNDQLSNELNEERDKNQKLIQEISVLQQEKEEMQIILDAEASVANAATDTVPVETERKFLLDLTNLPADMASRSKIYDIVQTYISISPEIRVRQINGSYYYFTLKIPKDEIGLSREEIELRINKQEYEDLLKKQAGDTIHKTRYQFYEGDVYIFVDVYSGPLEGLAVAEVEFKSVEISQAFTPPSWFGKDVTSDKRYKNANLAKDGMPSS